MTQTPEAADEPLDPLLADALDEPVDDREVGWWSALLHPTRRGWMLIISAVTTLVLVGIAFLLPVPFVKLSPGPTFNVIGEEDGAAVIAISGTQTYPVSGNLDMTTVYESGGPRGGLTFVDALASWLNPADAVVPRELLFPDEVSGEDVKKRQALLFSTSESNAVAAAMRYLDRPVNTQIVVSAVYEETPAAGALQPKDEVVSINGTPVTQSAQVADTVRSNPAGTEFTFVVRRDGVEVDGVMKDDVEQTVVVTSADNPDNPGTPYIGIGVSDFFTADFPIEFTLDDVGGPSAGLMFATGIVDKLTPGDLAAGQHVAGTGTIEPDGTVGPIGGIRQKLAGAHDAGATLFLMPAEHCTEAEGHVPDGLTVTPVKTLSEAISAVEAYTAGTPVPSCPTGPA